MMGSVPSTFNNQLCSRFACSSFFFFPSDFNEIYSGTSTAFLISFSHISGRTRQIIDRTSGPNKNLLGRFFLHLRHTYPGKVHHLRRWINAALIQSRFKAQLPRSDL
jgi:hypothetical protein